MKGIYEFEKWSNYCERLPLVAVIGLVNEWMTIYACLQQAIKVFDYIIIANDGADSKTLEFLHRFMIDHQIQSSGKIQIIDLSEVDPWPWLSFYDASLNYSDPKELPKNCHGKSTFKRMTLAKSMYINSLICSTHSDIVIFDDTRERIFERMKKIDNPLFDSEWFSMITLYDMKNAKTYLSNDSTPNNLKKDPNLNQRTVYDYPGDWGLMSMYGSSLLTPGPDPLHPHFDCLWPWSRKTQCEKKGQDNSEPHAVHLEYIRDRGKNKSFKKSEWSFWKTDRFIKEDINLFNRMKIFDDLYFPVKFWIDKNCLLRIEEI
jgi:hypothetical protein